MVSSITLAFVLCVLILFTWSILRPLRQLTDAANRIADGDLSARPDIKAKRGQIGKLALALERMLDRQIQTNATLELSIAQRTCELRQSQERLELAIAANAAGLWDWEPQIQRVTYNRSWATMLGYKYEELKPDEDSFFEKVHPDDVASVRRRLEDHLTDKCGYYESEHRVRQGRGNWLWVLDHGRVVERDKHGQAIRVIGLTLDVTHRRRAEEELRVRTGELQKRTAALAATNQELQRKNREMEQFVYSVSHDLKSPLVTIKGFAGVLKEDLGSGRNDLVMNSVRRIEGAATRMGRLIEDLLMLSRAGRNRGKTEPVDVSRLVRELTADLQAQLEELGTTLEIHDGMPEIMADRTAISRVFENLLNNAIKYGCEGSQSKITVGSQTLDAQVRFFVKDNGPGIAPEYHKKIFGLFQRLDSDQDGTGVGLAIVAKLMHVHDGRVWVESSPGTGATFWLSFDATCAAVSDHS